MKVTSKAAVKIESVTIELDVNEANYLMRLVGKISGHQLHGYLGFPNKPSETDLNRFVGDLYDSINSALRIT